MIVTLISQCEKKSIKRTRRILDAFADRIGDNTWQTTITEAGLETLYKLLKQSAKHRKTTAVSCHQIKSRRRSELIWIVGNRQKFDAQGRVAVNRTQKKYQYTEERDQWQMLEGMAIVSTLAALLHDIGKSTVGFQNKLLAKEKLKADPYRHEWISLKMLQWLLIDCQTDLAVFQRLQNINEFLDNAPISLNEFIQDDLKSNFDKGGFKYLPPITQWIAWLVITHHRLPNLYELSKGRSVVVNIGAKDLQYSLDDFYQRQLKAQANWVKNDVINNSLKKTAAFFQFDKSILSSPLWQKQVKRYAKKAENNAFLKSLSGCAVPVADPFLLILSRLSMMVGDHAYSSLPVHSKQRVLPWFDSSQTVENLPDDLASKKDLIANTHLVRLPNSDQFCRKPKQTLEEHLLGVAQFTHQFCRQLPILHRDLVYLQHHDPLDQDTKNPNFVWQNRAVKATSTLAQTSQKQGFFGVNMASTGCGKTLGNVRLMYALSGKRVRLTLALGLRVLTLQTGKSLREKLDLTPSQLAVLVGGQAHKALFEMDQANSIHSTASTKSNKEADLGSESSEDLLEGLVDRGQWQDLDSVQKSKHLEDFAHFAGFDTVKNQTKTWQDQSDFDDLDDLMAQTHLDLLIANPSARQLLVAPLVACTLDHIMQASECQRGGRYILPVLRLLGSDLILDEPDDFDQADLPALSRLVHLAGVFGSRVLLSSATLQPDMVQGLFDAYLAGRRIYNAQFDYGDPKVCCTWFDESCGKPQVAQCADSSSFANFHRDFVNHRIRFLQTMPTRRQAEIIQFSELTYNREKEANFYQAIARTLLKRAKTYHQNHAVKLDDDRALSVGLMRFANIQPLMHTAQAIHQLQDLADLDDGDTQFYLCCYHSQQVLALRDRLEKRLDILLNRQDFEPKKWADQSDLKNAMANHPDKRQHIFIVMATAVAEVGRDHDYDWAIIEPSSMRSIVQLAGRVWRHRPEKIANQANMGIWSHNILRLKNNDDKKVAFTQPGFETTQNRLDNHDCHKIMASDFLQKIDASVRIQKSPTLQPKTSLADLEHQVMQDLMNCNLDHEWDQKWDQNENNPDPQPLKKKINLVNAYYQPQTSNRSHIYLSSISPFRHGRANEDYLIYPQTDEGGFNVYNAAAVAQNGWDSKHTDNAYIKNHPIQSTNPIVDIWLSSRLTDVLADFMQKNALHEEQIVQKFFRLTLMKNDQSGYCYDENFGCWKRR